MGVVRLVTGDLVERLTELKRAPGANIQVPGSPPLLRWLLGAVLLDELHLSICPVVVGSGVRLFDRLSGPVGLERTRLLEHSGKDIELDELRAGVRVVAAGDALPPPNVTRSLVEAFTAGPDRPREAIAALTQLTEREREVTALAAHGLDNTAIATRLVISPASVKHTSPGP